MFKGIAIANVWLSAMTILVAFGTGFLSKLFGGGFWDPLPIGIAILFANGAGVVYAIMQMARYDHSTSTEEGFYFLGRSNLMACAVAGMMTLALHVFSISIDVQYAIGGFAFLTLSVVFSANIYTAHKGQSVYAPIFYSSFFLLGSLVAIFFALRRSEAEG